MRYSSNTPTYELHDYIHEGKSRLNIRKTCKHSLQKLDVKMATKNQISPSSNVCYRLPGCEGKT